MRDPLKVEAICPKCSTINEVFWFRWEFGQTGSEKREKVKGICKTCKYIFKVDDLD